MNNPFRENRKVRSYWYVFWVMSFMLISMVKFGLLPIDSLLLRNEVCSRKRVKELIINDNYMNMGESQYYKIQLSGHNPDGSVSGTAEVNRRYTRPVDRVIPIAIPSDIMEEFYDLLEQANEYLVVGDYQAMIFMSEDYPDRRIEVTGDRCTSAAYYSQSQTRDHWGATIGGKNFVTPTQPPSTPHSEYRVVDAPVTVLDAYSVIRNYLQLDSVESDDETEDDD